MASNTSLHPESMQERMSAFNPVPEGARKPLLEAREAVWRAWVFGRPRTIEEADSRGAHHARAESGRMGHERIHPDVFRAFREKWREADASLVFPRTEFQGYGNTVILYTSDQLDVRAGRQDEDRERGSPPRCS